MNVAVGRFAYPATRSVRMKRNNGMTFDCARALYAQKVLAAALVFAAICVFLLSCGGGGGGGGGSAVGANDAVPTVSVNITDLLNGAGVGKAARAARPTLDWTKIELTVYINDQIVYNETINKGNNDVIRIEKVKKGSLARAEAKVYTTVDATPRTAKSDTITVVAGTNKLTLYVPYFYTITGSSNDLAFFDSTSGSFTAKTGIALPQTVNDGLLTCSYTDSDGKPYTGGAIAGDQTFTVTLRNTYPFNTADDGAGGLKVTGLNDNTVTALTIPSTLGGKPITAINDNAFINASFTSVTIGNNVTSIGGSAFSDCAQLETVTLPTNLTSLGTSAFLNCTSLQAVTIPSKVDTISDSAFKGCTNLASVTIPTGVETIGECAFDSCALTEVTIPSNVTLIGGAAFYGCDFTTVTIPDKVTELGNYAFKDCTNLTSVTLGTGLTELKEGTFENTKLGTIDTQNVTKIGPYVFKKTRIDRPIFRNVTELDVSAFDSSSTFSVVIFKGTTPVTFTEPANYYGNAQVIPSIARIPTAATKSDWDTALNDGWYGISVIKSDAD